jgi:hypothetical protein
VLFGHSAAPERTDGPPIRCSTRLYREPTTFKVRLCVVLGGLTCVNVIGHPLYAYRGYDHEAHRDRVRAVQIIPHIARRGTEHGSRLGVYRWVAQGAIALLRWFRRLRIRWEIRDDIHLAFVTLGCAIICWRRLRGPRSQGHPLAATTGSMLRSYRRGRGQWSPERGIWRCS